MHSTAQRFLTHRYTLKWTAFCIFTNISSIMVYREVLEILAILAILLILVVPLLLENRQILEALYRRLDLSHAML